MENSGDLKNCVSRSFFRNFSTALTVPVLIASANLASVAQANDFGGRGAALDQFKLENPDLSGKALHQSFKEHWNDLRSVSNSTNVNEAASTAVNNAVVNANAGAAQRLHMNDFATKADFQAYKAAFKQQNDLNHINNTIQQTDTNKIINVNQGFSLDLTSAVESITLGNNLFKQQESVTINVGGQGKTLGAGSKVTAAEYVAAKQALIGGTQSVTLDADGRATGGSVDLSAMTTGNHNMKVDDLVVPVDVTASGNFSKGGDVRIQGDLVNSGAINAVSDGGKVNAWISADNITNNLGASINSTVSDLTLSAENSFNNYGTINATGNLTVAAGTSLTNTGTISAHQHLNVFSADVNNSGSISSTNADVTFDAVASNLSINNANGMVDAFNGAINIREAGYAESFNSTVTGGDLLSEELNVHTGAGTADVFVNQLTGVVNADGTAAHVSADTSVLTIGKQCLIGDPTYFNTGNIVLDGDIVVGETLAIIAGGNITATSNLSQITARDLAGQGYDINIIAGANITGSPTGPTPNPLPGQTTTPPNITGNATSTVTIDGPDFDGGNVDLSGASATLTINSDSTVGGGAGGDVTIAAFTNGGLNGNVILPTASTINAGGNGNTNGSVTVLGGQSVNIGSINTFSGTLGGSVFIASAQPVSSDGAPITFDITGAITTGNSLISSQTFGLGNVTVNDINAGDTSSLGINAITIFTAGAITIDTLTTVAGNIGVDNRLNASTQSVSITSIASGGAAVVFSFGDIDINGGITSAGITTIDNSAASAADISIDGNVDTGSSGFVVSTGNSGSINFDGTSIVAHDIGFSTGFLNLIQMNTLSAGVDVNGDAGSVTVIANSIFTPSGHLTLQAIGTGSGDGGVASLTYLGANFSSVSATGDFSFDVSAQGAGNGGTAFGDFFGSVSVDTGGIVGTGGGNGGVAIVRSNDVITVEAGGINVQGTDGDGAQITLKAGQDGSGNLNLNTLGFLLQANATGADHDGGKLDLAAETISFPGAHLTLQAVGTGNGDGGTATLSLTDLAAVNLSSAPGFTFSFDVSAPGSGRGGVATGNFNGDVTVNAGAILGTGSAGGGAIINTNGNITYQAGGINVQGSNGDGAVLSLNAGQDGVGSLVLNDTTFLTQADATGANGDGGTISLTAPTSIGFPSSLAAPLVLNARGIGNGDGGFVSYRTNNVTATFIVNPAAVIAPKPPVNFLQIDARSGSTGGHGGKIDVSVGGALTVDPLFMTAGPQAAIGDWDGAFYSLQSGTGSAKGGALIVQGSINANAVNAGFGGVIALSSRSSTAFSVRSGIAPKNGISGTLSASGDTGFIAINNGLGSVNVAQNGAMLADSIMLSTGAKGAITATAGVVINAAKDLTLVAAGTGVIGGKVPLLINTPDLVAQSNSTVGITNQSTSTPILVHDSFGKTFTLKTSAATTLLDITAKAGSIVVTQSAGGLLEVADVGLLTAFNGGITLQNLDTVTGSIRIGNNATVQTLGKGKPVNLVFGATIPKVGTNPFPPGPAPSGVTPLNSGKGIIYFGAPGTVTVPVGVATVNAKGVNVVFNSVNGRPITLGDGSLVLADPPVPIAGQQTAQNSLNSLAGQNMVGVGERSTYTSDLSVLNLGISPQQQAANNATLMTASNAASLPASKFAVQDDDNSYVVGYCRSTGETDGAICSDSPLVASQVTGAAPIQSIQHSERVSINSGNVLFVPFRDTVVETPQGLVRIGAKSVALVSVTPAGLAVYDLDDQHKGSVIVESNGHNIVLSPGRHVMVTPHHEAEFAQINSIESIAHRNVSSALKNGSRAHTSEFSVITAMDTVRPVKAMVKGLHPKGKHVAEHMMKTSAIILQLANGGQYQHYFKPRLTAMK